MQVIRCNLGGLLLRYTIDKGKGGIGNGSDLEKHPRLAYISFLFASTKLFA